MLKHNRLAFTKRTLQSFEVLRAGELPVINPRHCDMAFVAQVKESEPDDV